MKLHIEDLKKMIVEELELFEKKARKTRLEKLKTERERQREKDLKARHRSYLGGELMSLANGIAETPKKPNCAPGSPYHNEDGEFSSKADADSWSLQWTPGSPECKSGVVSMPGERATKKPCGRKDKYGGKSKHRCSDGQALWEEEEDEEGVQWVRVRKDRLDDLLDDKLLDHIDAYERSLEPGEKALLELGPDKKDTQLMNWCKRHGLISFKTWLNKTNAISRAQKGDLHKPQKD